MNTQKSQYDVVGTPIPFAVHFGEDSPTNDSLVGKDGVLLFDMSNPTHLGDEGDEAC